MTNIKREESTVECASSDCRTVFNPYPGQRYCSSTCGNRENKRVRRRKEKLERGSLSDVQEVVPSNVSIVDAMSRPSMYNPYGDEENADVPRSPKVSEAAPLRVVVPTSIFQVSLNTTVEEGEEVLVLDIRRKI